jgi:putative transposase
MNPPKCDELDYIHFLVAAQNVFSNTEAARCHPSADMNGPAHDAYMRLLYWCQADGNALWEEMQHWVSLTKGFLIIDDTTLDKPYSRAIELVCQFGELEAGALSELAGADPAESQSLG